MVLNKLLLQTEKNLENSSIEIRYLDANFPFLNGFPLLPHLSHNDGKKIDLSFIYESPDGRITATRKSRSGYGAFSGPEPHEFNQIEACQTKGYFQYSYTKYFSLGQINRELRFSEKGTKKLLNALLACKELGKMFIEPHLKQRMAIKDNRIRFQGCRSVRHDDHIHIQL